MTVAEYDKRIAEIDRNIVRLRKERAWRVLGRKLQLDKEADKGKTAPPVEQRS